MLKLVAFLLIVFIFYFELVRPWIKERARKKIKTTYTWTGPEHFNCRCVAVPIVEEKEEPLFI